MRMGNMSCGSIEILPQLFVCGEHAIKQSGGTVLRRILIGNDCKYYRERCII